MSVSENFEKRPSGERLILGKSSKRNEEDHLARYHFAKAFVEGKRVLDIACGTGYGTKLLKDAGAVEIVGVDIDNQAIEFANENYAGEGIKFLCDSVDTATFDSKYFDVVVTYETIEHLESETRKKYLLLLRETLKDDGIIILSTPNKLITSPWSKKPLNPFHVLEYYRSTLDLEIAENELKIIEWYGQRYVRKIFTYRPVYLIVRLIEKILRTSFGIYDIADSPEVKKEVCGKVQRYFIVLIKKR